MNLISCRHPTQKYGETNKRNWAKNVLFGT